MNHLTTEDAARWVAGLLDEEDAARLEAHASKCPECEARIQREAGVQQAVVDALIAPVVELPVRRATRTWVLTALAASAVLLAGGWAYLTLRNAAPPADDTHFANERPPPEALLARAPFAF